MKDKISGIYEIVSLAYYNKEKTRYLDAFAIEKSYLNNIKAFILRYDGNKKEYFCVYETDFLYSWNMENLDIIHNFLEIIRRNKINSIINEIGNTV